MRCIYAHEPLRGSLADKGDGWYRLQHVPGIGWVTLRRLVTAGSVECDGPLTGKRSADYAVGFRLASDPDPDLGDLWVE